MCSSQVIKLIKQRRLKFKSTSMTGEMIQIQALRQPGTLCTSKKRERKRQFPPGKLQRRETVLNSSCPGSRSLTSPLSKTLKQFPGVVGLLCQTPSDRFFGGNKRNPEVDCCSLCSYRPVMLFLSVSAAGSSERSI